MVISSGRARRQSLEKVSKGEKIMSRGTRLERRWATAEGGWDRIWGTHVSRPDQSLKREFPEFLLSRMKIDAAVRKSQISSFSLLL